MRHGVGHRTDEVLLPGVQEADVVVETNIDDRVDGVAIEAPGADLLYGETSVVVSAAATVPTKTATGVGQHRAATGNDDQRRGHDVRIHDRRWHFEHRYVGTDHAGIGRHRWIDGCSDGCRWFRHRFRGRRRAGDARRTRQPPAPRSRPNRRTSRRHATEQRDAEPVNDPRTSAHASRRMPSSLRPCRLVPKLTVWATPSSSSACSSVTCIELLSIRLVIARAIGGRATSREAHPATNSSSSASGITRLTRPILRPRPRSMMSPKNASLLGHVQPDDARQHPRSAEVDRQPAPGEDLGEPSVARWRRRGRSRRPGCTRRRPRHRAPWRSSECGRRCSASATSPT